ncbi:MAG: oxidoreductase [Pirellula sp.]|nr:oxidoreductase [Pirellula sp.]
MSTNDEQQQVVWVTGSGAKRVGATVARRFAERGATVVVHANRSRAQAEATVAELSALGARTMLVVGDLREEAVVARLTADILKAFGRIDVLVNSAAIWNPKPLEEVRAVDVRDHFEVNTLGTFLCCQAVGLAMVRQPEGGAIVNIGDWAVERPYQNYSAYFPSKGAIPTLTRMFAVELAARNPQIRVNAVLPGPVMLPADLSEAERAQAVAGTLVRREGSPENVAAAVLALVDNTFITGVCLPVDGGRTIAP